MKFITTLTAIAALNFSTFAFAQSTTLDELLNKVKKDHIEDQTVNKEREAKFNAEKDKQTDLMKQAQAELAAMEKESEDLKNAFSVNEKTLAETEEKLKITMGTLGEMFGVVRQVAGDTRGTFEGSLISAQFENRNAFIGQLAEKKEIPTIDELENLWFELQREMTESGKVVRFKAPVVLGDGSKKEMPVTRIGTFNLISEGKYLKFLPETQKIVELGRQPSSTYVGTVAKFEAAKTGFENIAIDPSRGVILSLVVQAPDLLERAHQGGTVGYVILAIGLFGLLIVAERLFTLYVEGKKIEQQLKNNNPDPKNPIGRLMIAFKESKETSLENLELRLSESILKSIPKLERGIGTIKIIATVGPLLGLLGTVTGMIETFQAITMFGAGDPKLMAGGISTALVTTVLGLIVAIPMTLLHNQVSNKSQGLIQILEEQSVGMMAEHAEGEKA